MTTKETNKLELLRYMGNRFGEKKIHLFRRGDVLGALFDVEVGRDSDGKPICEKYVAFDTTVSTRGMTDEEFLRHVDIMKKKMINLGFFDQTCDVTSAVSLSGYGRLSEDGLPSYIN